MSNQKPTTIISGTTRGLGRAMAEQLATSGHRVITLARRSVPELIERAKSHETEWNEVIVDLSDRKQTQQAGDALLSLLDGVQEAHFIHNAGTVNPIAPADQLTDITAIDQAYGINIVAPIYLTACFLKATAQAQDRRIMLVSSGAGHRPSHGWGVYCSTKAALDHYAQVVKLEAHANTRISSVAPGVVDTDLQETLRTTSSEIFPNRGRFEKLHRDGALTSPEVIARQLFTLLLDEHFGERAIDDVREHKF